MRQDKTEKLRQAVALSYDQSVDQAPKVVASGKGDIAGKILEVARNNEVPIQEDPSLVELLGKLKINETIPDDLYQVVAEIFAFVYQLEQKVGNEK